MADERAEEIGYFLRERVPYFLFTNYKNDLYFGIYAFFVTIF